MKKLIIVFMLIISAGYSFGQTNKKLSLDERAINIISQLKDVKELEESNKPSGRSILYITDKITKSYVEISVCVNVESENRIARTYFYKYYSNGKLYKMDIIDNEYKLINYNNKKYG